MRTRIADFTPNTDGRKAAEILAGMLAFGVIKFWQYDDLDHKFDVTVPDGEVLNCAARDVIWMGRGVLLTLALNDRMKEALSE